ncbi:MAG: hypothetical protein R8G01_23330 [Ilumatobacteraceae bacterium]|nr:hypothetical protein [Ilumatobacteraceae bacterium]
MNASIVRIVGPSYCGSTVLGCAMNTGTGVFFGSEIYRYLSSWRAAENDGRFPSCDFCGPSCDYWSEQLRDELEASNADRISLVHQALLRRHPEITMLVDGSKSVPDPDDDSPDFVISPRKHPMRLIASHLYNRRRRLGIDTDDLGEIGATIDRSLDEFVPVVHSAAAHFLRSYRTITDACPDAHVFRADEADDDSFAAFRHLEAHLGIADGTFDPARFSQHAAHTIGGNRQPIWMTRRAHGQSAPTNARTTYYDSSVAAGDWKQDDKYQVLFSTAAQTMVCDDARYQDLCDLLGYGPVPLAATDDSAGGTDRPS